ncbi:MAG: trypsin-like peptidase domain-containing protein [Polyangiaceae bacterium]
MRTKSTLTLVSGILALAACSSVDGDRDVGTSGDDDVTVKEVASGLHTETASSELGTVTFRAGRGGETEKIIGTNDLTVVRNDGANLPAKYRDLVDAFGLISMGCTATHIGNGIVLTAGHCFNAPSTRRNNVACSESIQWGLRVDKAAYMTSRCQTILAYETNDDRDYAILRVSPAPTPKIDVDLSGRPATNTTLTIFGHPQARPLEWSQTCPLKPGSTGNWGADQFSHQCDTEPGNSGSTVLADDTLRIVGIHDGGLDPWNYGTYLVDTPIAEFVGGTAGTGGTAGGSGTGGTAGGSGTGGTGGSGGTACPIRDGHGPSEVDSRQYLGRRRRPARRLRRGCHPRPSRFRRRSATPTAATSRSRSSRRPARRTSSPTGAAEARTT